MRWLGEEARSKEELGGHVVLIRFFTNTCPFCRTSAPALAQLHREYGPRGLEVRGIFHPKPRRDDYPVEDVQAFVDEFGWEFPVALDNQWTALDRFWPPASRSYTSFSFLIDRSGRIRLIHPGPEFHASSDPEHEQCDRDFRDLEQSIEALLAETP